MVPGRHRRLPVGISICIALVLRQLDCVVALTPQFLLGTSEDSKDLGDVAQACDIDAVQEANIRQLHPILHDLVNTTFFRLFRVNLKNPSCPFWKSPEKTHGKDQASSSSGSGTCTGSIPAAGEPFMFGVSESGGGESMPFTPFETRGEPPCSVDAEEERDSASPLDSVQDTDRIDTSMTSAELEASEVRRMESDSCEFEEDLPTYFVDMCSGDSSKDDSEDVNLMRNPERNTGYNGSHIWEAMYNENCFEVGSGLPRGRFGGEPGMCYEERVLYRLLSGWHASTTISITKNYYAPGTRQKGSWAPNVDMYMEVLGSRPERTKNLHFSFVVMLRAIKKAGTFLNTYRYSTGDGHEDGSTKNLVGRLLDSQVLSVCSPLFDAFDETRLFRGTSSEQRSQLKRQFKSVFQNITVLVDCVQCQRCRLHAKLFSLGLGSALKILLTPPELIPQTTSRDEVVALVNVLWKLSEAMEDARSLTELYLLHHKSSQSSENPEYPMQAITKGLAAKPSIVDSLDKTKQTSATATGIGISGTSGDPGLARMAPMAMGIEAATLGLVERRMLLDMALGAVRRSAAAGALAGDAELSVLRSLVVQPATDEVLLLAKHYAADRPELFVVLAHEVALSAGAGEQRLAMSSGMVASPAPLGSDHFPADAVVIGGGLAGMVATLTLLDRGASVVMIEKQPYLGGNSGKASSGINAALETSAESLIKDTTKSAGVLARPNLIEKLANDSAPAVDWLRKRITVDLSMRSQLGGHTVKRTLRPSNAFVGAEITFAIGQVLNKMATQFPHRFRLLTRTKWTALERTSIGWRAKATVNESAVSVEAISAVIASGGFGHDAKEIDSLLLKNRPDLKHYPTTLGAQTTGDGVKIARDIGAKLVDMDRVQLHPSGFVDVSKPDEHTKTLAAELLRGVGGLILDRHGRRITDELGTRQAVVDGELRASDKQLGYPAPMPARTFALVLNSKAAAMADRHVTLYSKKGLLKQVSGIQGLADSLNVTATILQRTFREYNDAAHLGRDQFNRTVFPAGHWPIEEHENFHVGYIVPVIHYTMGGIAIDADARVLAAVDDQPLPGLYAIGEASGGVHGDNRLAGNSLLECTVFGRHVGLSLPIQEQSARPTSVAASLFEEGDQSGIQSFEHKLTNTKANIGYQELAQHKTREQRSWVALYGNVYDLTDYIDEHPGGTEAITDVAGIDGTEHFAAVHNRELLESMGFEPVGILAE
mmetsp:Transcript_120085/g.299554  ORF Transcript_120085/g.299554 Transcript_120085/m.299554 type:complete len:1223 (-) Transcript_120085:541-4209(-)